MDRAVFLYDSGDHPGGYLDASIESAMGGAHRELISLAKLISEDFDTEYYAMTKKWSLDNIQFLPLSEFKYNWSDYRICVSNGIHPSSDVKNIRSCCYHFALSPGISRDWDLIITDTIKGKELYEILGIESIVLYPSIQPSGFDNIRLQNKILLISGPTTWGKRIDIPINAMPQLPDYELHIIGSLGTINENELPKNVIWHGILPYTELLEALRSFPVIVIPYITGGTFNTNVALESIANGCVPLIVDGLTDYLDSSSAIILPDEFLNSDIIIQEIRNLNDSDLKSKRENGWRIAQDKWEYQKEIKRRVIG